MSNTEMSDGTRFEAVLQRPARPGDGSGWCFLVLPKAVSGTLPRRGRTSVNGTLNGQAFRATLEPDGKRSHWLKVDDANAAFTTLATSWRLAKSGFVASTRPAFTARLLAHHKPQSRRRSSVS